MFDSRRRPERDDKIPLVVTSALVSHGVTPSEYPFSGLSSDAAGRIVKQIRDKSGLPLVTLELSPNRSLSFILNNLRFRAHILGIEKDLEKVYLQTPVGLKTRAMLGDFEVRGFFGHSGLTAVYHAIDRVNGEVGLVAVPLDTTQPNRLEQPVPRGFYSYVPKAGVVSKIMSSEGFDAAVEAELSTMNDIVKFERQRYQGECRLSSHFHMGHEARDFSAMVFRTGEVFSLRHHQRLKMPCSLRAFVDLCSACERMGGHGNLSPESIVLADGGFKAVLNPSVELYGGHFFTSNWEYNPFRKRGLAADVVAIGIMLYEDYARERPFKEPLRVKSRDLYDMVYSAYTVFPRPSTFAPLMKEDLDRLIMRSILDRSFKISDLRDGLEKHIEHYGDVQRSSS